MLSCKNMRRSVLMAVILFGLGSLLLLITNLLSPIYIAMPSLAVSYIGLILIVSSPIAMIFTLVRSLLPGSRSQQEQCIH